MWLFSWNKKLGHGNHVRHGGGYGDQYYGGGRGPAYGGSPVYGGNQGYGGSPVYGGNQGYGGM